MPMLLRSALDHDFDYCRRLYFNEMQWIIEQLQLDKASQEVGFLQQWNRMQVRMIVLDDADIGWIQTIPQGDELFIAQMFVDRPFQRKGIGTEVMKRLLDEAAQSHRAVRLNVVKINPAWHLYERLGFRVIHEDDRKFYMKHDPDTLPH